MAESSSKQASNSAHLMPIRRTMKRIQMNENGETKERDAQIICYVVWFLLSALYSLMKTY